MLKIEELTIQQFVDIAQTSNREQVIIDDQSLEQDLCGDPDLENLATVSIVIQVYYIVLKN